MAILTFQDVELKNKSVGGKAWGLARLHQAGFPVPEGLILTSLPDEAGFARVENWWAERNHRPLAVRSSAAAEDSAETSFAGQNRSFLNVRSLPELRTSASACFASGGSSSSLAYRRHFTGDDVAGEMNVVVQEMVDARFSGVFFSEDPRTSGGWILEVISGLGEDLVSGRVSPGRFFSDGKKESLPAGFSDDDARTVAETGLRVAKSLGFAVDMEWAIDRDGRFRVLQARPITTQGRSDERRLFSDELARLEGTHPAQTTWDGQTFAEWNGAPTALTFSLWKEAFSPHHAFGDALRELGYRGFDDRRFSAADSLLEDVFGRAYINLDRLSDLYYGPIPYSIEARPRPHTKFAAKKVTLPMVAEMPRAVWSMMKVAYNVSTRRKEWLRASAEALNRHKEYLSRPQDPGAHRAESMTSLKELFAEETEKFAKDWLHWPLLLVVLTESTIQNLRLILKSIVGESEGDRLLRSWMASGLHTVTREMMDEMKAATLDPKRRPSFLARYGHRGPGEMELSKPRWAEMKDAAFQGRGFAEKKTAAALDVEAEIAKLRTFKADALREEWRLFKRLLEHREQWKMELLKPYAQIRYLANEIGRRAGLGGDVHWLQTHEIQALGEDAADPLVISQINERRARFEAFRALALPEILTLSSLRGILAGEEPAEKLGWTGEPLSPGIAFGQIRYVEDPSTANVDEWPDDVILAASATDPGWTELFLRSKGILVERGGVLSHCAIVARELSIPAVSGIPSLKNRFKDGDRIWIDGSSGRIRREGDEK